MLELPTSPLLIVSGPVDRRAACQSALELAGLRHVPGVDAASVLPSHPDPIAADAVGAPNAGHTPGTLHPETLDGPDGPFDNPLIEHHGKPYEADPTIAFLTFAGDQVDLAQSVAERCGWTLRAHHTAGKLIQPETAPEAGVHLRISEQERRHSRQIADLYRALGLPAPMAGGAANSPPYALQASSHSAQLFRQAITSLVPNPLGGVVGADDLLVTQNGSPNMSVNIAGGVPGGQAWIPGTTVAGVQAMYFGFNDATANLAVAASSPTNPRIDRVVAQVQDAAYAGAANSFSLVNVVGTPAGSPVAPSAPASSLTLAFLAIAANATSVVTANITDARPNAMARPQIIAQVFALAGVVSGTPTSVAGAWMTVSKAVGVWTPNTAGFTVPQPGSYLVVAGVQAPAAMGLQAGIVKDGVVLEPYVAESASGLGVVAVGLMPCLAGDQLGVQMVQTSGSPQTMGATLHAVRVSA